MLGKSSEKVVVVLIETKNIIIIIEATVLTCFISPRQLNDCVIC